ncbi:hypothetical protein IWX75_001887 [Arthrobacter sp. CAN_A6]|uniref:hypothetical protein n=1 Tax=Arthrobacter sp. CAN_A6 TaxID=2787721 RepID=UPI0018CB9A52
MDIFWIFITLVVAGGAGWPVTTFVLRLARTVDAQEALREEPLDPADQPQREFPVPDPEEVARLVPPLPVGVLRGGLVIGVLERLAVATAVLTGEPVAIAYVVAIKGLGRYAELKETPAAAERFIIGTLTSMLWGAGTAIVASTYLL